jgi:hypothetical protein
MNPPLRLNYAGDDCQPRLWKICPASMPRPIGLSLALGLSKRLGIARILLPMAI